MDNNQKNQEVEQTKIGSNAVGIVGFVVSFFLSIAGLILSIIGIVNAKNCNGKNKGLSIAGVVISSLGLVFKTLIVYLLIAGLSFFVELFDDFIGNVDLDQFDKIKCIAAYDCVLEGEEYSCIVGDEEDIRSITCNKDAISDNQLKKAY